MRDGVRCKYLFIGEAEIVLPNGGTKPAPEGCEQCTFFFEKEDLPPWVERGMDSYPINFPDDCINCPVYQPDPIQKRIMEERKGG